MKTRRLPLFVSEEKLLKKKNLFFSGDRGERCCRCGGLSGEIGKKERVFEPTILEQRNKSCLLHIRL